MIKIVGIFKVKGREQFGFITNTRLKNNQIARCFFAFKEKGEWQISWTTSNLNQLRLSVEKGMAINTKAKDLPGDLAVLIQENVDKINGRIKHDQENKEES